MIFGLLSILFVILCFLIIFIILLQKSKGSLGISGALSSTQLIFGGSGGQDIFQKITWVFIACFLGGSLLLSLIKNRSVVKTQYVNVLEELQSKIPVETERH